MIFKILSVQAQFSERLRTESHRFSLTAHEYPCYPMLTHKIPQGIALPSMSPFLGTHQNRLDVKGRVSVPAPFRAAVKDADGSTALILRPSHKHPCIEAWPAPVFHALAAPLQNLDLFSEAHDDMAAALYADAYPVEADKEGRVMLPAELVAHAGLGDAVTFVGLGNVFQIWEPAAAAAFKQAALARAQARGTMRASA
jgi:MraZ protein